MKIKHALRADSRWDTWRQSRLRSTQRTLHDDTLEQLSDLFAVEISQAELDELDRRSWLAWEADEWQNWWDYSNRSN